jgi:purine-cytosine permease-like protein
MSHKTPPDSQHSVSPDMRHHHSLSELAPHTFDRQHTFEDKHQGWWFLASIQIAAGLGSIPVAAVGARLRETHGLLAALLSIVIGNLILYVIGLPIVLQSSESRKNTFQMAAGHFGVGGKWLAAVALVVSALSWFSTQLYGNLSFLQASLSVTWSPLTISQYGVGLGLASTLLFLYRIRALKWSSLVFVPVMIAFFVVVVAFGSGSSGSIPLEPWSILSGVSPVFAIWLAGVADYATFFRHSRSTRHSVLALTAILVFAISIEIAGIFMLPAAQISGKVVLGLAVVYAVMSCIIVNAANLYSGTIGFEALAPKLIGLKEIVILGLSGTLLFGIFRGNIVVFHAARVCELVIGSLAPILAISIVHTMVTRNAPASWRRTGNAAAWYAGITVGCLCYFNAVPYALDPLLLGPATSIVCLMIFLVIREVVRGGSQTT